MSENIGRCASLAVHNALDVLSRLTNLSTSSLTAIREAIESGNPLCCIANKELARMLTVGGPYKQATGEEQA